MVKKKKHIVVAEDDPGIVEVLKIILEDEGYIVQIASTKKEIEAVVKKEMPDLFFLDILLDGVSGKDIAHSIRNNTKTADIPIVMVSANMSIEKIAKESGANDYLQKPFEIEELLSLVKKYIH